MPRPGRRREPVPGAARADRRRPARRRRRGWSSSRRWRATPTSPTRRACPRPCATRATCSPRSAIARAAFGEEVVGALPQRRRRRARGLRGRRDRLGARPGIRAAVRTRRASTHGAARHCEAVFAPVQSQTAFEETVDRLGTAIKLGLLPPGARLPAERELCPLLGIARSTLRQALTALGQSGHLHAVRGRGGGTFVTERPPARRPAVARAARGLARGLRRASGRRARRGGARGRSGHCRDRRSSRSTRSWSRWTTGWRTSPPTARPTCASTWGWPRRRAARA